MKKVLFVCTGNTCRSSMAVGIFKKLANKEGLNIEVDSAGVSVIFPTGAAENAVKALKMFDIDISDHVSKQLNQKLIEDADLILAISEYHKQMIIKADKSAKNKTFTIIEYADENAKNIDIEDPYGCPIEAYAHCAKNLNKQLMKIVKKLK